MVTAEVPQGRVQVLVERPYDDFLVHAAAAVLAGNNPSEPIRSYSDKYREFLDQNRLTINETFGAIAIGGGARADAASNFAVVLHPERSKPSDKFLLSGVFEESGGERKRRLSDGELVHGDPPISGLYNPPCPCGSLVPCRPTCGTSCYVGNTQDVRNKLGVPALNAKGLHGSGVWLAIVDSGIFLPRIRKLLGDAIDPAVTHVHTDPAHSWNPSGLATKAFKHRLGHGTMCAYDALIAAPKATLLDIPTLLARPIGDHHVNATVAAAIHAYLHLLNVWTFHRPPTIHALVVSNSWGIFHPSMEDYPPGDPRRFIDNPDHIFRQFIQWLAAPPGAAVGADVIFCGNNCGGGANCAGDCASGTCLSKTDRMIMGSNAYEKEVLTVGGCDTNDEMVGYSSRGPSILKDVVDQTNYRFSGNKPDLVAYTHFLGSRVVRTFVPDTGVSAACPVAAGCVAALRTKIRPTAVPPALLFDTLRNTARKPAGGPPGWDPAFGHGIVNPVAAAHALGVP
jgi:hypothetical protein